MLKKVVILSFLFLPYFVTGEDGEVYEYTSSNFRYQVEEMDGNFVMFYAPWCHFCTQFNPIWAELAELVNTKDSKFAIARLDCTQNAKLCQENDITGYPTLLYYHKNSFSPIEFKGLRDLPSLTLFLSEVFTINTEKVEKELDVVKIHGGMAQLTDHNIDKFISKGQHFIIFYTSWSAACQRLAPIWSELAAQYANNEYINIGKVNCIHNEMTCNTYEVVEHPLMLWIRNGRKMAISHGLTLEHLQEFVERMLLTENHDPDKFMRTKKALPVARISEETFDTFLQNELVFVNYFAPWCGHCMQLSPVWVQLGERFMNDSRVLIADVDCVHSKTLCSGEKIDGLPTLILYKQKHIVTREQGSKPLDTLVGLVTEHLKDTDHNADEDSESIVAKDEL